MSPADLRGLAVTQWKNSAKTDVKNPQRVNNNNNNNNFLDQPEYWEKSWRPEECNCLPDSSENHLFPVVWKTHKV